MLKLSRKTLLALEAVIDIAFNARPEPVQAKEITARQGSRGDIAYTLVDVDAAIPESVTQEIAAIQGVLAVRVIPAK